MISLRAAYNQRVVELHKTFNGSLRELITAAPLLFCYREKIREEMRKVAETALPSKSRLQLIVSYREK